MADIKEIAEYLANMTAAEVNNLAGTMTLSNFNDAIIERQYPDMTMSPKEYGMSKMNRRKKR